MKRLIILLFLLLLVMNVSLVYAGEGDINLAEFPNQLATALGVSPFVGQLLASLIFMSLFLFPGILLAGYFGGPGAVLYTIIIVGLSSSGVCVALGWLPVWLYAITCFSIAVLFGSKFVSALHGEKS